MIKEYWNKYRDKISAVVNRETVTYFIFGVLTTLVDWIGYKVFLLFFVDDVSYVLSAATAIVFAYVTNKIFVFQSQRETWREQGQEFLSFVSSRVGMLFATYLIWAVLVDFMGMDGMLAKIVTSAISMVGNYVFSKLLIFRK